MARIADESSEVVVTKNRVKAILISGRLYGLPRRKSADFAYQLFCQMAFLLGTGLRI